MLVSTLLAVSLHLPPSFKEGTVHDPGQRLFLSCCWPDRNEQEDAAARDDAPHQEHQEYEPEDGNRAGTNDGYADPHPQAQTDPPLA